MKEKLKKWEIQCSYHILMNMLNFDEYLMNNILSWKVMNIKGRKKRQSSFSPSDLLMRETYSRCD